MKLQAVILTGARDSNNPLLAGTNLQTKVLLPVGGKPMVVHVLENVAASAYRPKMYLSTDQLNDARLVTNVPYTTVPSGNSAVQSLLRGLESVPGDGWVLFVSGDHPLLTPEMVNYFVDDVITRDLTMGVAVVNRDVVNQAYPQSKRTYFHAKGGSYSGANMQLINKRKFMGNAAILETIDRNRKKPWKSVTVLDPWSLIQVLTRQLTMYEVAERASRAIGCETSVVEMPFAECCMDVDKLSDKEIAEQILAARAQAAPLTDDDLPRVAGY